ncbi:MAG: phosphonate degradation HD-domain oxygenase [Burkholderiaceae bacterium]
MPQLNHGHLLAVYSAVMNAHISAVSATIEQLFLRSGDVSYGEDVTQREHALQAAYLAQEAGAPHSLILAALLHDVGHLLHPDAGLALEQAQDDTHEQIGASWLAQFFGPPVSEPVNLHVQAKRYLCWADPDYYDGLSDVSKRSLALQGGVFSSMEAKAFLQLPYAREAISLRQWDEQAKVPQAPTPSLHHFLQSVRHCLEGV